MIADYVDPRQLAALRGAGPASQAAPGGFMEQALGLLGGGNFQPAQRRQMGQMNAQPTSALGALGGLTPQQPLQNLGGGMYSIPPNSNPTPNLGAFANLPAAERVNSFFPQGPMGGIQIPKGAPTEQDVVDFFSVNLGRKPTAYEIEYYTNKGGSGKSSRSINRWQQLIADTGKSRDVASAITTGWESKDGSAPLDMSKYVIQALQGMV